VTEVGWSARRRINIQAWAAGVVRAASAAAQASAVGCAAEARERGLLHRDKRGIRDWAGEIQIGQGNHSVRPICAFPVAMGERDAGITLWIRLGHFLQQGEGIVRQSDVVEFADEELGQNRRRRPDAGRRVLSHWRLENRRRLASMRSPEGIRIGDRRGALPGVFGVGDALGPGCGRTDFEGHADQSALNLGGRGGDQASTVSIAS